MKNDVVTTQIHLYNDNKSSFVAEMGEVAYNHKIIKLLNKLPDPSALSIGCDKVHDEGDEEASSNN
jgi:hypothetical protein